MASPQEASGIVAGVMAGDVITVSGLGCIKLADVKIPDTPREAIYAQEFTWQMLLNSQVYLDIDDLKGNDGNGCLVALVYRANKNGTPNLNTNFNRMLVDAGKAVVQDDPGNEFDPAMWWCSEK